MLTKWSVENFKSIRDETELELAPLTIIAGANSSGKSAFTQSILLIAQTLNDKVRSIPVVLNGPLVSLGQFDDLKSNGSSQDQITIKFTCDVSAEKDSGLIDGNNSNSFSFFNRNQLLREISCDVTFGRDLWNSQPNITSSDIMLYSTKLSCIPLGINNGNAKIDSIEISNNPDKMTQDKFLSIYNNISLESINNKILPMLSRNVNINRSNSAIANEPYIYPKQPVGCELCHFLPEYNIYIANAYKVAAWYIANSLLGTTYYSRLRFFPDNLYLPNSFIPNLCNEIGFNIDLNDSQIRRIILRNSTKSENNSDINLGDINLRQMIYICNYMSRNKLINLDKDENINNLFTKIYNIVKKTSNNELDPCYFERKPLFGWLEISSQILDDIFSSRVKYLGPLRYAPKPLYPLPIFADQSGVGVCGENTAYILELYKNKTIIYIPSKNFENQTIVEQTVKASLETAVIDWLHFLGVANALQSRDLNTLGHELKVGIDDSGNMHNLSQVGVGVSQVLPILVMCLLAEPDSTLIFEQPELHLHPLVQSRLADFFFSMALCKKQCIVETHSEYLIDQIRARIAAAQIETDLISQVKIYFVEKLPQGSHFREVIVNQFGAITDWPKGFFDQSQEITQKIIMASISKRKAIKERKNG